MADAEFMAANQPARERARQTESTGMMSGQFGNTD
jgi:hypothetical protein